MHSSRLGDLDNLNLIRSSEVSLGLAVLLELVSACASTTLDTNAGVGGLSELLEECLVCLRDSLRDSFKGLLVGVNPGRVLASSSFLLAACIVTPRRQCTHHAVPWKRR